MNIEVVKHVVDYAESGVRGQKHKLYADDQRAFVVGQNIVISTKPCKRRHKHRRQRRVHDALRKRRRTRSPRGGVKTLKFRKVGRQELLHTRTFTSQNLDFARTFCILRTKALTVSIEPRFARRRPAFNQSRASLANLSSTTLYPKNMSGAENITTGRLISFTS